jgi:U6 snRNA-associated Sm-like protein LSm2
LFYSFFKSLVGKEVIVELKNDLSICGTLHSVDQFLNIKLTDITVPDPEKYPHMVSAEQWQVAECIYLYKFCACAMLEKKSYHGTCVAFLLKRVL